MRYKLILSVVSFVMCGVLVGCGLPHPTNSPKDMMSGITAAISSNNSEATESYARATCTYYAPTGEIGTFEGYTKQGQPKSYSTPETSYHTADGMVTFNQYVRPNIISTDFTTLPDNAFSLIDFLETSLKVDIISPEFINKTEAVFKVETTVNEIQLTGFLGVSVMNNENLFTQLAVYADSASDDMKTVFEDLCIKGFSKRVFTEQSENALEVANPNQNVETMYVSLPEVGYDILTSGKTIAVKNPYNGTDLWVNKDTCVSIQRFDIGHTDLSITEYNIGLEKYQKLLVPNSTKVENLKIISPPTKSPTFNQGFWIDYSVSYKNDNKNEYIAYNVIADEKGFTVVTIHSNRTLTDKTKKLYTFISSEERKTNGQYAEVPSAILSPTPQTGSIEPVYIQTEAITALSRVSSEFMLDKFGENNVSGPFMNKQLYYKDNFIKVLLPFTSSMSVPAGTTESASSSYVPYFTESAEQTETSKINLYYTMVSDSSRVNSTSEELTDMQIYGFESVAQNMLKEYINQMEDNNILFSTDSENVTNEAYQREFTYRFNDDVTNKQYTRHGALFIKHIDSDNYEKGSEIYFVAILDWGTGANSSKLQSFQQAFESTVKQLP